MTFLYRHLFLSESLLTKIRPETPSDKLKKREKAPCSICMNGSLSVASCLVYESSFRHRDVSVAT